MLEEYRDTMKLNEPGKQNVERQNSWQQEKDAELLFSDLLRA